KIPPWGSRSRGREQSRSVVGAEVWRDFSIGVDGQVLMGRKQRSNRDAVAAPRGAWEIKKPYQGNAEAFRRSAQGGNRYMIQRSATRDEQILCQVGPKNLFIPPSPTLPLSHFQNSPWGRPSGGPEPGRSGHGCGGVAGFFNRRGRAGA